jgi:hypothetical protein
VSITHLPPGEGKSFWIGNSEFATIKTTGKDTAGEFALVEIVRAPSCPIHRSERKVNSRKSAEGIRK